MANNNLTEKNQNPLRNNCNVKITTINLHKEVV